MDTQDEKSLIEITNRRKIKKNKEKYKHMHATKLCIPFLTLTQACLTIVLFIIIYFDYK